ncbi:MAG: ABC transporter permease [Planctomycetes bacterium]|nr:ABC transporter permease [Planctomycetota bacterium]
MIWLRQVWALAIKEFLTILKDKRSRFLVIGPPLIQFFVFGYAATFDVQDVAYAVVDQDRSPESRDLLARFAGSRNFECVATLDSPAELRAWIDPMHARLGLCIAADFSERLHSGRPAELQVVADGRNSNVSGIALGYVQAIVADWNRELATTRGGGGGGGVEVVERSWYNPALQSRWFIVSGLPAQLVLVVVMLLTSLSVAREREQGTFDQTLVAPLNGVQILIGKSVPPFLFGLVDGLLLSAGAVAWFGVPFTGTVPALVAVLGVYALAVLGIGLFVSSLSATLQQGLLGSFVVTMPAVILSGFTTPIENMPRWLQAATVANPARYAVAGARAVLLEGAELGTVVGFLVPMLAVGAVCLVSAGWLFRLRSA